MKKNLLLPHSFEIFGWAMLIPAAILGLMMWFDGFNGIPKYLYGDMQTGDPWYIFCHSETMNRLLNNIALIGTVSGCLLITCSRAKVEDEMIGRIRLNALLAALYINSGSMIVSALLFYDMAFLDVMLYNLIGLPLLFLLIFQCQLRRLNKETDNEE